MLPTRARSTERMTFLSDVVTTAVEGGIGYWSQVEDYRWYSPDLDGGTAEHPDGQPNAYVTIHEVGDDPDDPDNVVKTIGVDDIARAIKFIKKNADRPGPEWMHKSIIANILLADRLNDAGELDAGDCDCIVQVAMFEKVIYG